MLTAKKLAIYIWNATILTFIAYYSFEPHFAHAMGLGIAISYGFTDKIVQIFTRCLASILESKKHYASLKRFKSYDWCLW
jgi:hypothetical protein